MTNIRDLAKIAGVSVTTVSRVLNNHPYVSQEKKDAVSRAIKESNYHKNINAVHLSKGRTNLIGVAVPFSDHPYFGLLLKGIANESLKNNYKLVLFQTNYEETRELEALEMLKQKQIDSLIICSRICDWKVVEDYLTSGPIVLCEKTIGDQVSSTYIDHYKSFSDALNYLFQKGHRKIGYCIGRRSGTNSKDRHKAYRHFLKERQLCYRPEYVFDQCLHFEDGSEVINKMKQLQEPPTALLVTSDQVAAGIAACSKNEGIAIPENLALVGFNNEPIAQMMNITTVEIPLVEMGINLLRQAVNKAITRKEIDVTLIERESV
ncbi:LacI family DNA-binding transcriptional regulator [Sediminibacillus massiliensis]|uniref:LacI family DNA-binding transcriptional regulator n=1 Tax=Sediminibacillus massiliensis TaxID=1926277 RepID=UPI0009884191|nr:LacI family DNA-binding transcriptional regulator [Sediminibacillus massiliensis]